MEFSVINEYHQELLEIHTKYKEKRASIYSIANRVT